MNIVTIILQTTLSLSVFFNTKNTSISNHNFDSIKNLTLESGEKKEINLDFFE